MGDVQKLIIRSEEEAIEYLKAALGGAFDNQSVLIEFDGWPSIDIDVEGARYHSSLPTGMLKGLVEYQSAINRFYASISYGRSAKSLTEEDRKEVELVFNVSEGSTDTEASLWETLTKLGQKAIERMTGKQLVVTVLGAALIAAGTYGTVHWQDTQAAIAADANKKEIVTQVLAQNEHLAQMSADVSRSAMTLIKGAYDADRIKYGDVVLDKPQIEALTQRGRETTSAQRVDGAYEVIGLKKFDDRWKVTLYSEVTGQVQTDLFRGQDAAACIEEISAAFARSESVDLLVLGRYKAGSLQSATVLGSAKSGLLAPDAPRVGLVDEDEIE